MIDINIVGDISVVSNLHDTMKKVADLMRKSVDDNFANNGRPPWLPLKPNIFGQTQAYQHGVLRKSVRQENDGGTASVIAGENLPYARIQNFGGINYVPITDKSRRFFWYMWFTTRDEMWKSMALMGNAGMWVKIPARTFMMFQEEDITKIMELVGSGIIKFTSESQHDTGYYKSHIVESGTINL
jgi:phage gpG-like protein